ncbi:DUF2142 domain-containing protein [Methylobacterium platani]|uniref:DUF2142 domain-containing protein n=1 Tax=Methylobacterium platani TaxID=427683 RepID=A0A179S559_9HYPH|nr:DUF2142 domain-containing protein [Methylobacterium platani]OAS20123.1 hypothetical protein A5481_23780 [Methylobacterium platani]
MTGRLDRAGPGPWLAAFALLGLPLCLILAVLVPLGQVADESAHLLRAVALLDGQAVGHRETVTYSDGVARPAAGVTVDPAWEAVGRGRPPAPDKVPVPDPMPAPGRTAFLPLYTIGTYFPGFYVPAALGLGAARALGLGHAEAALLGRLADVAAYGALGLAALALARRGRALLFGVLVLPMSLSLAASFNQDGLMIATCALAAALLTGEERWRRRLAALLVALVVLAKPPYAAIAAMLLVPLPPRFWTNAVFWRRVAVAVLAVLPGVVWILYVTTRIATPVPRLAYEAGPLWTGPRPAQFLGTDTLAQARILLDRPALLLTLPAQCLFAAKRALTLAAGAIGIFGWIDRPLPAAVYAAWGAGLVGLVLLCGRSLRLRRADLALLGTAALVTAWLVALSQYLSWTGVGEARIDGPQGRYFLPLVPMLVLAVAPRPDASSRPEAATGLRWALLVGTAVAALDLVVVPLATARMF